MKRAILFGNGEYQDETYYRKLLENDSYIAAIDGGLNFLDRLGVTPDLIIGDLDSVNPDVIERYKEIETLRFPVKKNKSDTEIAIEEINDRGDVEEIILAGMLGGRIDHSLSNLLLLERFAKRGVKLSMVTPDETLVCLEGPAEIQLGIKPKTTVSLLPLSDEVKGITISGFEYPLENAVLSKENPSLGLSNITDREKQTIEFESGILLIIINEINKTPN